MNVCIQRKIITFHAVCVLQWAFISAGPVLVLPSVSTHLHGLKGGHVDAHLVVLVPGIAMLARRSRACPARWLIHLRVQHGQAAARDGTEHDHAPRWSAARPHQRILGHCAEGWLSPNFTSQQEATKSRFHKESSNLRDALSLTIWPAQDANARTHIAERSTLHA